MFDPNKLPPPVVEAAELPPVDPLEGMDEGQLFELRARIDAALPPISLTDINLESEILQQYRQSRALFTRIQSDTAVPANQKAQLANSCSAILKQLLDMQAALYTAERLKAIEQALIKVMREMPRPEQEKFFENYERIHAEH